MNLLAHALLLGAFCGMALESAAAPERPGNELRAGQAIDRPAAARNGESAAVTALLDAMDQALGAGRPEEALALLERALRIEPRNAALWHYLGIANLESGHYAQAEAMAAKSQSLAGSNRTLRTRNEGLTAAALRAQGKPALPASRESASLAARRRLDPQLEPAVTYVDTRARYERENRAEQRRVSPSAERAPRLRTRASASANGQRSAPRPERRPQRRYRSNGYQL